MYKWAYRHRHWLLEEVQAAGTTNGQLSLGCQFEPAHALANATFYQLGVATTALALQHPASLVPSAQDIADFL